MSSLIGMGTAVVGTEVVAVEEGGRRQASSSSVVVVVVVSWHCCDGCVICHTQPPATVCDCKVTIYLSRLCGAMVIVV